MSEAKQNFEFHLHYLINVGLLGTSKNENICLLWSVFGSIDVYRKELVSPEQMLFSSILSFQLLWPEAHIFFSTLCSVFPAYNAFLSLAGIASFVRVCLNISGKNSVYASLFAFYIILNTATETQHHHSYCVYFSVCSAKLRCLLGLARCSK